MYLTKIKEIIYYQRKVHLFDSFFFYLFIDVYILDVRDNNMLVLLVEFVITGK
jgi:hypothetical protein